MAKNPKGTGHGVSSGDDTSVRSSKPGACPVSRRRGGGTTRAPGRSARIGPGPNRFRIGPLQGCTERRSFLDRGRCGGGGGQPGEPGKRSRSQTRRLRRGGDPGVLDRRSGEGDHHRPRPGRRRLRRPRCIRPGRPGKLAGSFGIRRGRRRRVRCGRRRMSSFAAAAYRQGQRSPRLKVTASKGGMHTGSSSFAPAISTHCPSRSSDASRVRSAGSTSHRCRTSSRA